MMTSKLIDGNMTPFEQARQEDENGNEFWSARDLQLILEYLNFRNFESAIEKAKIACRNSGQLEDDHFAQSRKMVQIGSGAVRSLKDYRLSRYA